MFVVIYTPIVTRSNIPLKMERSLQGNRLANDENPNNLDIIHFSQMKKKIKSPMKQPGLLGKVALEDIGEQISQRQQELPKRENMHSQNQAEESKFMKYIKTLVGTTTHENKWNEIG